MEVNRVWFFLIYSAKKTRDLFVPRRFRIPPTPAVRGSTVDGSKTLHGTIILLSIFVTRLIFERKKQAASHAFMKT